VIDRIEWAGRAVREIFARVRGQASLLARVFGIVVLGVAITQLLGQAAALLVVFRTPGEATVFVIGELQSVARVPLELSSIGRDVVVFLGLF
jgi:hypothetical protein